jgi:opacity protein-like surface antigen
MNHFRLTALVAMLCAPCAVFAADSDTMPDAGSQRYWSVQGGVNNLSRWPATVNFGGPSVPASLELDRGAQFGAALGRQNGNARYELEYQHGRFGISAVQIGATSGSADANGHYDVLTVNALRRLPLSAQSALYAGLGVGVGKLSLPDVAVASGCHCVAAASKTGFTWLARLGAETAVGAAGRGFVQLSWLNVPGAQSGGASYVSYPRRGFAVLGVGLRQAF